MTTIRRRVARRLGFRGLFLTLFGSMFVLIGATIPFAARRPPGPPGGPPTVVPSPDPYLFHTMIPLIPSVAIWVLPGLAAVILSWGRNPTKADQRGIVRQVIAFTLLFIPPAIRFASYFVAFYTVWGDFDFFESLRYVPACALYCVISLSIVLFASWPEPSLTAEQAREESPRA